jgi:hypothetical protein
MSLNLSPSSSSVSSFHSSIPINLSLKNGFEKLKLKNLNQVDKPALNVSFSARYNTQLTAYLAGGQAAKLLKGLQPDEGVHRLHPTNVSQLL